MDSALRARNLSSVPAWFDRMADAAIRRSVLAIGENRYALVEVEFYFSSEEHPDPFVHRNAQQLTRGQWYFHREKAAALSFTLKGLDLTFGSGTEYGGMLIRAIARPDGTEIVEGPSKVVDAILIAAGVDRVTQLKALPTYSDSAFSQASLLRLEARANTWDEEIRAGPRVGLKNTSEFAKAAYRYRACVAATKRDKSGVARGRLVPSTLPVPPAPLSEEDLDALIAEVFAEISSREPNTPNGGESSASPTASSPASPSASSPASSPASVDVWGVVGYRHFTDYPRLASELAAIAARYGLPCRIVSGGAAGADTLAKRWAREQEIELVEYLPSSQRPEAFLARNTQIVEASTHIIAFLSPNSRGTKDTLAKARRAGRVIIVIHVD